MTTLLSSSVPPLSQPFLPNTRLHVLNRGLPAAFNWLFYTVRHVFSLSAFTVLWEIFKDFKKIIEAITSNTKVHFNSIEKCKSLHQSLKAFSFYLTGKPHGLGYTSVQK